MLDTNAVKNLASTIGLDLASVLAVAQVESGGRTGFQPNGELTVLFEAHLFYAELRRAGLNVTALQQKYPNLISPVWNRALYKGGDGENARLKLALTIHPSAARCASYGMFQILGSNCVSCGFPTAEKFVAYLKTGQIAHVATFLKFVSASPARLRALQQKDWATFARLYNGPAYAQNKYDVKIAQAYQKLVPPPVVAANPAMRVTSQGLNVRSGAAATFPILGTLKLNDKIVPLETKNGWVRIAYQNKVGWVSAAFLSKL